MKNVWKTVMAVGAVMSGCAAGAPETDSIGVSEASLTTQECGTQRDTCVRQFGFLGALTICPTQYTTCMATASNGLPAAVTDAVSDAADCTDTFATCTASATSPSQLAGCAEAQAQCVAGILDVEIPSVVTGTTECVEGGVDCINAADSVGDLTACGETLVDCAADQVVSVIPEEVTEVIEEVTDCTLALNACVQAATTPSQITACGEQEAVCVAGSLNVELPNVPVSEVVECTESAADCALAVESLSDVAECVEGLQSCAADVVASLETPPVLDCGKVWTACMTRNPFNFLGCAAERRACERR